MKIDFKDISEETAEEHITAMKNMMKNEVFNGRLIMGIYISLNVSKSVTAEEWSVY